MRIIKTQQDLHVLHRAEALPAAIPIQFDDYFRPLKELNDPFIQRRWETS